MIVYKYRRDSDTTAQMFTSGKVWLSTPAGLNDPFESELHSIDEAWRKAKVEEMKAAQLAGFLEQARTTGSGGDFFGINSKQVRELLARFHKLEQFDEAYALYRDFMERQVGNPPSDPKKVFTLAQEHLSAAGIFSLSEVPDHPLMWAHYAEDHKGLCVGFEVVDGSVLASEEKCLHVRYADAPPKLGDGFRHQLTLSIDDRGRPVTESRIGFSDVAVRAAISTKGPEWQYEREWRYVEPLAGLYNWPGPIVEITFGVRCPRERREHYAKLAREHVPNDVRLYEMRKVPDSKSLQRVRLAAPRPRTSRTLPETATVGIGEIERLMETRNYETALLQIEKLLQVVPGSAELWRWKGIALGWAEDSGGALACFERAISLQPDFFSAWYQKGVALTALARYEDAIAAYLEAQRLFAGEPSVAFNLGVILGHLARYDEALVHLQEAERLNHARARSMIEELEKRRSSEG